MYRRILMALLCLVILAVGYFALVNECAYHEGMGSRDRQCECRGYEIELFDHTPADGPRKTICLGLVESRTCYQYIGGPEIECDG